MPRALGRLATGGEPPVQQEGDEVQSPQCRGDVVDAEGRPEQLRASSLHRQRIARRIEVEYRRRAEHVLPQGIAPPPRKVVAITAAIERTHHPGHEQRGLAQAAGGAYVLGARVGIEQHGRDGGHHVPAHAAPEGLVFAADEGSGHPLHVGRRGVASHQVLDQLLADEGRDVRMLHQAVEHRLERLRGAMSFRQRDAGEQRAWRGVMRRVERDHVAGVVGTVRAPRPAGPQRRGARRVGPAREGMGVVAHTLVVVGRHAVAPAQRPVHVQLAGAQRKELQQLAAEVLVRCVPVVVGVVLVAAHDGRERDLLEDAAVVAEGLVEQHVVVVAEAVGAGHVGARDHQALLQRQSDALAQLVGLLDGVAVEVPHQRDGRGPVAPAVRAAVGAEAAGDVMHLGAAAAGVARFGRGHLAGDPLGSPLATDLLDERFGGPKARLVR